MSERQTFIPQRVRQARESAGLTQDYMADWLGLHRTTYSEKERGISAFTVDELSRVSDCLDIPVERFFEYGGWNGMCPYCRRELDTAEQVRVMDPSRNSNSPT